MKLTPVMMLNLALLWLWLSIVLNGNHLLQALALSSQVIAIAIIIGDK